MIKLKLLSCLLLLASCSALPYQDESKFISGYLLGFESDETAITEYQSSQSSFAKIKIGRGPSSKVILAYISDDEYEWRSADGISLFTNNGFLFKTDGFEHDVFYKFAHSPLDINIQGKTLTTFYNPDVFNQSSNINTVFLGQESILYLEKNISVDKYKILVTIPSIKFKGESYFYVYQGRVVRSDQIVHPRMPRFKINFFYK